MSRADVPDRDLAIRMYQRVASTYDSIVDRTSRRMRQLAVQPLQLQPGQIVLDIACGTGLSFEPLEERVGPTGRVIGIDLSSDMLARARSRADAAGWDNVMLIEAPIEEAEIPVQADAALFLLTHDVMRSAAALENVIAHLKPGARVAGAGAKWAPWWAAPVNSFVWLIARRYVTTFEGMGQPWDKLAARVPDLGVRTVALGGAYIASGAIPTEPIEERR